MIIQQLMDLIRDIIVNFLAGISQLWPASSVTSLLSSIGLPADLMGHGLAILFTPTGWGICITTLISYGALFVGTGVIKIITSRIGN